MDDLTRRRMRRAWRLGAGKRPPRPIPHRPGDWQVAREDLRVIRGLIGEVAAEVAECPDNEVEVAYVEQLREAADRVLAALAARERRGT